MTAYAEFRSGAELLEHYKRVHRIMWGQNKPVQKRFVPPPAPVAATSPGKPPKLVTQNPEWVFRMDAIISAVSTVMGVSPVDMKSNRRMHRIALARQIAYYIGRKHTLLSLPAMGRILGHRDHTPVLHGVRKITDLIERQNENILRILSEAFFILHLNTTPSLTPVAAGQVEEGPSPVTPSSTAPILEEVA